jgi:hypothetical protein
MTAISPPDLGMAALIFAWDIRRPVMGVLSRLNTFNQNAGECVKKPLKYDRRIRWTYLNHAGFPA